MATETLDIRVRQQGARTVARDIRNIGLSASAVTGQLSTTQRVLRGLAIASVSRRIAAFADGFTNLNNKVAIYSKSQQQANATTNELIAIANRTRVGIDAVSLTFQRLAVIQDDLGLTTERTTRLVELLSKAVILGGSSAQEAGGALRQFSQGLASNFRAAAQELNSVLEQTPGLAKALADGLGIATGEIKALAKEGKLTSDLVVRAIEAQAEVIESRFAKVAPTIGQAFTVLETSLTVFVGRVFEATEAGKAITNTVIGLSQALIRLSLDAEKLGQILSFLGTVIGGLAIKGVVNRLSGLAFVLDRIASIGVASALQATAGALKLLDTGLIRVTNSFVAFGAAGVRSLASIDVSAFTNRVAAGFDNVVALGQRGFRALGNTIDNVGTVLKNLPLILSSVAQSFLATGTAATSAFRRGLGGAIDNVGTVLKNLQLIVVTTAARFKALGVAAIASFRKITFGAVVSGLRSIVVSTAAATAGFVRMGAASVLALGSPLKAIKGLTLLLRGGLVNALKLARAGLLLLAINPFTLALAAAGAFLALLFGVRNETVEVAGEAVKVKDFFVAAFNLAKDALSGFADSFLGFFGQKGDGVSAIRGFFNIFIGLFAATFKTAKLFVTRLGDVFKGIGTGIVNAVKSLPEALAAIATGDFKGAGGLVAKAFGAGFEEGSEGFGKAVADIFKTELAKDQLQAITDLIAAKFPELTAEAVRLAAARELAKKEAEELAVAQGKVAKGAQGLLGGLSKEGKALTELISKTSVAAEVALDYQKNLDILNAAFIKGLVTQKEAAEILETLATKSFRELAAETDPLASATIEYNTALERLNATAKGAALADGELAAAQKRLRLEFEETTLEIKAQNDQLSATDAAVLGAKNGLERFRDSLGSTFSNVSDLISSSLEKGFDAISEFTRTGELDFKAFTLSIIAEIQKITLKLLALQAIRAFETRGEAGGGAGGFLKQFFGERLGKTGAPGSPQTGGAATDVGGGGFLDLLKRTVGGGPELEAQEQAARAEQVAAQGTTSNPFFVKILPDDPALNQLFEKTAEKDLEMEGGIIERQKQQDATQKSLFERLGTKLGDIGGKIGGFFTEHFGPLGEKLKGGFDAVKGFLGIGNSDSKVQLGEILKTNTKGFGDLVAKLAKEAAGGIAGLLGGLGGGGGGGGGAGGGGGGGLSSILSLVSTGLSLFGGGAQEGALLGPNALGKSFLVGEAGPELFQPRQTGEVISNSALANAMTPQMPEINVNITNVDDAKSIPEAISTREGEQSVMNVIQRNKGRLKEILT